MKSLARMTVMGLAIPSGVELETQGLVKALKNLAEAARPQAPQECQRAFEVVAQEERKQTSREEAKKKAES